MTERIHPGVVLEIGVGGYPFPVNPTMLESHGGRQLSREFKDGSMYIGKDYPHDPNRYWHNVMAFIVGKEEMEPLTREQREVLHANLARAQTYSFEKKPGESINFLIADAHNLPFRENSVDEVFLNNVFGSQLTNESLEKILENINYVLKPEGQIVIRETGTPQWSWQEQLPDLLAEKGFKVDEMVNHGSKSYSELLDIYGATFEDVDPDINPYGQEMMYYCIASKVQS